VPALLFVSDQIFERIARVESLEDRSIIDGEVVDSKDGVRDQPDDDDRSEKKGDLADSERLNDEEQTRIASVTPTTTPLEMVGLTTLIP